MSSANEHRTGLRISIRMALWYALFFVLTVVGIYGVSYQLIDSALEREWEVSRQSVERNPGAVTIREERGLARPTPATRAAIDHHFRRTFLLMVIPIGLLGVVGGALMTFWAARPVRRVVATVGEILRTGDLNRRVPEDEPVAEMNELASLINRMLDRINVLMKSQRESLDNVAHDLRTPLARLRASAERAAAHPEDRETVADAIADSMEETERLVTMIDTLMDVAEAETGTMTLSLASVSVPAVVGEIVDLYEFVAEDKRIAIDVDVPQELEVQADRSRLRQVLANLVDNAIKYSDEGGQVAIRARVSESWLSLAVEDHGRGIADEDLPRIWDRLYRGDRSRGERGLGLGLSVVRAVVAAHRGKVAVESELGRGSTFTIRLPLGSS